MWDTRCVDMSCTLLYYTRQLLACLATVVCIESAEGRSRAPARTSCSCGGSLCATCLLWSYQRLLLQFLTSMSTYCFQGTSVKIRVTSATAPNDNYHQNSLDIPLGGSKCPTRCKCWLYTDIATAIDQPALPCAFCTHWAVMQPVCMQALAVCCSLHHV